MSAAAQVGGKGLYLEPMALEARGGTDANAGLWGERGYGDGSIPYA